MKFNCGPTAEERIRRKCVYHRWFAWRPVRIGANDCRWLEFVFRKGTYHRGTDSEFTEWKYLPIEGNSKMEGV